MLQMVDAQILWLVSEKQSIRIFSLAYQWNFIAAWRFSFMILFSIRKTMCSLYALVAWRCFFPSNSLILVMTCVPFHLYFELFSFWVTFFLTLVPLGGIMSYKELRFWKKRRSSWLKVIKCENGYNWIFRVEMFVNILILTNGVDWLSMSQQSGLNQ